MKRLLREWLSVIIILSFWTVSRAQQDIPSETTTISYKELNELANIARQEVLLDSLYRGSLLQISHLKDALETRQKSVDLLQNRILVNRNELIQQHADYLVDQQKITKIYKKQIRKEKAKKWFWIVPIAVISYTIGSQ